MKRISVARWWGLAAVAAVSFIAAEAAIAQTAVRIVCAEIEMNGGPYSYSVMRSRPAPCWPRSRRPNSRWYRAHGQRRVGHWADGHHAGCHAQPGRLADTAHVTFTVDPEVLRSAELATWNTDMSRNSSSTGRCNYGIWEFSYWGSGGPRQSR
jgi:hypothetical protein